MQKRLGSLLRVPLYFTAFLAIGLVFGFLTFTVLSFSRTIEVPNLVPLSLIEANEALTKAGLYLKIEGEDYDSSVSAGKIIRQDVPAGNKVKEKRSIRVIVSKGPRVFSLPLLVNETLADAEAMLLQKGLRIGKTIQVHSDTVEKGKIIAQRPEPEDRLTDIITVLVSLGPHEMLYYCPDLAGKDLAQAKEIAGKIGLVVEAKGTGELVKSQKPRAGAVIKSGDVLYLEMKEDTTYD